MIERTFVRQGIRRMEMETYLKKELHRAGFTKAEIIKTPMVTRIVVNVVNPGLAIGKSGANIKSLTELIEKRFKIDNPQLEIRQIEHPELDAQAQADKIKSLLERGFSWRSVAYKAVKEISGAGAQGVELLMRGKLAGKGGRKRKQRIAVGYMKKVGHQAKLVDTGKASAYPKAGAIGIKVSIVRPDVIFPDKVNYAELLEQKIINETEAKEVKEVKEETKPEAKLEEKKEAKPVKEEKAEKKPVKPKEVKEVKKTAPKEEKKEVKKAEKPEKKEIKKEEPKKEEIKKEAPKPVEKTEPKKEEKKEVVKEEKKEEKEVPKEAPKEVPKETPKEAPKEEKAEEKPAEKKEEKPAEKKEEKPEEKKE
jgi:small subunit ribosomal protein S3